MHDFQIFYKKSLAGDFLDCFILPGIVFSIQNKNGKNHSLKL